MLPGFCGLIISSLLFTHFSITTDEEWCTITFYRYQNRMIQNTKMVTEDFFPSAWEACCPEQLLVFTPLLDLTVLQLQVIFTCT